MSTRRDKVWTVAIVAWMVFAVVYFNAALAAAIMADNVLVSVAWKVSILAVVGFLLFLLKARFGGLWARGRSA